VIVVKFPRTGGRAEVLVRRRFVGGKSAYSYVWDEIASGRAGWLAGLAPIQILFKIDGREILSSMAPADGGTITATAWRMRR